MGCSVHLTGVMMMKGVTQTDELVRARVDDVRIGLVRLGSLVSAAVGAATGALTSGDLVGADQVIADDDAVDAQRHSIEDDCLAPARPRLDGARRAALRRDDVAGRPRAGAHGRSHGQRGPHRVAPLSARARGARAGAARADGPPGVDPTARRGQRLRRRGRGVGRRARRHGRRGRRRARPPACATRSRPPTAPATHRCSKPCTSRWSHGTTSAPATTPSPSQAGSPSSSPAPGERNAPAARAQRAPKAPAARAQRVRVAAPKHERSDVRRAARERAPASRRRAASDREERRVWGSGRGEFPAPHAPPSPSGPRTSPTEDSVSTDPPLALGGGNLGRSGSDRYGHHGRDALFRRCCLDVARR